VKLAIFGNDCEDAPLWLPDVLFRVYFGPKRQKKCGMAEILCVDVQGSINSSGIGTRHQATGQDLILKTRERILKDEPVLGRNPVEFHGQLLGPSRWNVEGGFRLINEK
jgi:hypothetical protein